MVTIIQKIWSWKTVKAGAIGIIGASIILFGIFFGPGEKSVEAKVFERLIAYTRAMPEYLFDEKAFSEPRKVRVNGNTTYLRVGRSRDDISKILDFYEKQYPAQPVDKTEAAVLKKVNDKNLRKYFHTLNAVLECMRSKQRFRMERDGFGFLGTIEFRDSGLRVGSEAFIKKYETMFETGEFGKMGIGRMVIAQKDPNREGTRIVNIWTGKDFNIKNFLPDSHGDVGGEDIPDIPRYPGSRRVFSTQQENLQTLDCLVVYEGGGGVVGHILFYHARMNSSGWKTDPAFEKVVNKKQGKNFMFYTRKGRECTIHIREGDGSDRIITTITSRDKKKV